jgi:hypothetical protein
MSLFSQKNTSSSSEETRITEDPETLDEAYERLRINALPPEQQRLVYLHQLNQYAAVPCYFEQQAQQFATE